MNDELKPCPFCGAKAQYRSTTFSGELVRVSCSICTGSTDLYPNNDYPSAVKYWNTRPIEDAFRDALEKVSGALHREIETTERLTAERDNLVEKLRAREDPFNHELSDYGSKFINLSFQAQETAIRNLKAELEKAEERIDDAKAMSEQHLTESQRLRAERDAVHADLVSERQHYTQNMERLNNLVGPEYWGVNLIDAVENEFKKRDALKAEVEWLKAQLDQVVLKMITPELEACQAARDAAKDELAYMRQQRDGWMNSYNNKIAEMKTLKDELDNIDQVGFAEFQKSQKLQSELEKVRADLAAADGRFITKIGLEIAKTAYEKSQNETIRTRNEQLREALERFSKIDLTKPVDPAIVYDILHARAVLEVNDGK